MKVKWRQHEMILAAAIFIMICGGYVWNMMHLSPETVNTHYANVFKERHVPFSLYRNVIFPDAIIIVAIYTAYFILNLFTIPRLLFPPKFEAGTSKISVSFSKIKVKGLAKNLIKNYLWLFIQLVLIIFVLGVVFDVATYLRQEWQFHYPGFSIFFNPDNQNSQLSLAAGFFAAIMLIVVYSLYVLLRECIIYFIQVSKQHAYNTLICNKVTGFTLQFVCIPVFLTSFNIIHEANFYLGYLLVIPAIFAMFISNVYWLFPKKGDANFFSRKIIIPLLSTSFVYAIPLVVFVHEEMLIAFIYSWALQLFVVTPLTWWYYKTYEDKILQLRIVEKQLVKSKADIQFLRSQINPHFLFNVLNTLYGAALQENASVTAEGIQKLGDMMRFMLHENNMDFIDMHKEVNYLCDYIALQRLRTQSSADIIIEDNISDADCNHKIAPMLLIPFVENAFKHGISLKEKSWIKIKLECTATDIAFEVRNSMHEKNNNDPEKERSGIGFKNVLERLKLIYPGRFQISVNGDGKEFYVQLSIQP
ncbi:hypothetical protein FC093_22285 [Ilyomonas limi]|uniref:Signal transduction histidine kinase internal region domain-containing protein n=1 Tax=Ilyomonas limi TaxID=2575867 RepID=A0A4U3KQR4_9BACT|nr:histidine kinase [Ilyomonas limi]TKK64600.1 hypothetical protein FC093_22285 [Ilyomonas limi]